MYKQGYYGSNLTSEEEKLRKPKFALNSIPEISAIPEV